ncbi:DUF1559 domain-containing protein [Gemmata sp. G18]|uniref:DUF1559 domain-containing protein n=1 Tax=Gemmata palustris TaxID=2822762 RepID=A0ABS5BKR8_9BACT|nr:DUF1559 domain-containing protein [Gemmata palustris]MBP3954302.1 DUF1559 domain-containing protein [Gemmata palustris]
MVEILVTIFIIATLIGLLIPAVQKIRMSAAATKCQNNLRQIGLSLHQYENTHKQFPPGVSWESGRAPYPHMSWLTRLLPYIEQDHLWAMSTQAYEKQKFFESPPHLPLLGHVVPAFICPTDSRCSQPHDFGDFKAAFTTYLGVEGTNQRLQDGILYLDSRVRPTDVRDGLSNTLLVGERPPSSGLTMGWWYAGWGQDKEGSCDMLLGAREILTASRYLSCPAENNRFVRGYPDARCDFLHFWSLHSGGSHFLLADGAVRFLRYEADSIIPALATRAGGEMVAVPD